MFPKCLNYPRLAIQLANRRSIQTSSIQKGGHEIEHWWGPERNNGREVVDRMDYWYPAIRFRKDDDIILPIKEKEKGNWKDLTLDEKKLLYRYSYKQTLAEFEAPNGYWKPVLAGFMLVLSFALSYATFLKLYVSPPLPPTMENEYKETEIERALVLQKGQFMGAPVHFDYENNRWKS